MHDGIITFLEDFKILTENQFGVKKNNQIYLYGIIDWLNIFISSFLTST